MRRLDSFEMRRNKNIWKSEWARKIIASNEEIWAPRKSILG